MFGIYNMISVAFGFVAVVLPLVAFFCKKRSRLSRGSLTAALLSLCSQLAAYNTLVRKADWSALLDTSNFTLAASVVLTVIVVALNLALRINHK